MQCGKLVGMIYVNDVPFVPDDRLRAAYPYLTGVRCGTITELFPAKVRAWLAEHHGKWAVVDGQVAFADSSLAMMCKMRFG